MDIFKEILYCVAGTLAFAVTMRAPRKDLAFIVIGATISSATERVLSKFYGDFTACLCAMICIVFFSEIIARMQKEPATVILMPSTIPLLPGSSIYYMMFYAIQGNSKLMINYGKSTVLTGVGIALGAVISTTIIRILNAYRNKNNL